MSSEWRAPSSLLSEGRRRYSSLGERGEELAERFLTERGMRILARGFRTQRGEIDLIAEDGEELVFVEVKTRASRLFGDPLEAVTPAKRRRILRAASVYLLSRGCWDRPCRFDLVAIRQREDGTPVLEHLTAAFGTESFPT